MNLVDSCGWLEYFADSPYADVYAPAIEDTGTLLLPLTLNGFALSDYLDSVF